MITTGISARHNLHGMVGASRRMRAAERHSHYIPEWARQHKLSRADIARATGAQKSLVSKWFNDRITPGDSYIEQLAALFGCSRSALFQPPENAWFSEFAAGLDDADRARAREILRLSFPKAGNGQR